MRKIQVFRLVIVVLFFVVCSYHFLTKTNQIKADSFAPHGLVQNCKFASTIGIQYFLPDSNQTGINYNFFDLSGKPNGWIENNDIFAVANLTYPNAQRYPGVADKVRVPPGTRVQIGLFAWNYSGHSIQTDKVRLFTSKSDPNQGDLTALGAQGNFGELIFNNGQSKRTGKYIDVGFKKNYQNRTAHKGDIIYEFTTKNPIQFISRKITPRYSDNNLIIDIELKLKNTYRKNVCSIKVVDELPFQRYEKSHCINAK